MEDKYVKEVYENIAIHFSDTRFCVWNCVKEFLDNKNVLQQGLEIGCGNGKNILYRPELNIIGIDNCNAFINMCNSKNIKTLYSDCCQLPFIDNSFDYVYSIAVFHHLENEERRIKAFVEMIRVLKPNGEGLITVWSVENQENETIKRDFKSGDNLIKWHKKNDDIIYQRYYYIYDKEMINNYIYYMKDKIKIIKLFNEHGNWVIHFQKI